VAGILLPSPFAGEGLGVREINNLCHYFRKMVRYFDKIEMHPRGDGRINKNNRLFVTLYAKSTDKMPRQHTSNPKIPKVSKAIGSPFY
jgi:hypothetical protein